MTKRFTLYFFNGYYNIYNTHLFDLVLLQQTNIVTFVMLHFFNIFTLVILQRVRMKNFTRELSENLIKWKNNNLRKPLILRGARQVGKTTLVKQFAESYEYSIMLNLEKTSDQYYFENYDNVKDIADALFLKHGISPSKIN